MHFLSRSPGGWRAWYALTTYPQYLMTLDKPSKWSDWKNRFYLVSAPSKEGNREYRTYNRKPDLMGNKCKKVQILDGDCERLIEAVFFELTTTALSNGLFLCSASHIHVSSRQYTG